MATVQESNVVIGRDEILAFVATLSTPDFNKFTDEDIQKISDYIGSDGCTMVAQIYKRACIKHDFMYRTHRDFTGEVVTRAEADRRFRLCIQSLSGWHLLSPISWVRWLGVRIAGRFFW